MKRENNSCQLSIDSTYFQFTFSNNRRTVIFFSLKKTDCVEDSLPRVSAPRKELKTC